VRFDALELRLNVDGRKHRFAIGELMWKAYGSRPAAPLRVGPGVPQPRPARWRFDVDVSLSVGATGTGPPVRAGGLIL
jgi:hypothetical protein